VPEVIAAERPVRQLPRARSIERLQNAYDLAREAVSCTHVLGSEPPRATTSSSYPTSSWGLGWSSPSLGPVVA